VLARLCALSLEPDSCVRRTENIFVTRGVPGLLVAKFLPGLNAVAAALAGISGVRPLRFLGYSATGGLAWAGGWISVGYVFSDAIQHVLDRAASVGVSIVTIITVAIVTYVIAKYVQRRRFLRHLRIARITPGELKQRLDAGEDVVVVDLRAMVDAAAMPYAIPGALRLAAEELEDRHAALPRDREIVLYCT
jgi:hypothetical protein